jgi:hypothetical protein
LANPKALKNGETITVGWDVANPSLTEVFIPELWAQHAVREYFYPRRSGKSASYWCIDEWAGGSTLRKGDRVRIKEGYELAGEVRYYIGKSIDDTNSVRVGWEVGSTGANVLAAAIEPYPYTTDEKAEKFIEDLLSITQDSSEWKAALHAMLTAEDGILNYR